MKKNNFDTNSQGPNIELSCFLDTDLSRMYFEENFKVFQYSSRNETCKAYYIDNGNVPDDSDISFNVKGTKEAKIKYLADQGHFEASEIETWDDDTIESEIIGYMSERPKVTNYQILNENDLSKTDLEIVPSKTLVWVSINGYSQGDYAEIAYCPEDLEKCWGNAPVEKDLEKMFDRYFYDAPIYCSFEIDGEEYRYNEYMPDNYEWDKEAWAKIVSEKSGIEYETILKFLPEYPDYN